MYHARHDVPARHARCHWHWLGRYVPPSTTVTRRGSRGALGLGGTCYNINTYNVVYLPILQYMFKKSIDLCSIFRHLTGKIPRPLSFATRSVCMLGGTSAG